MATNGDKFAKAHAQTNSKDFPLAFPNLEAIENSGLPADLQLREKVKHLSMQLFGLAVDLGNEQRKYVNFDLQMFAKDKEIKNLRMLLAQSRAYIKKYCVGLKASKSKVKELQDGAKAEQKAKEIKRINDLTTEERQAIQADYYEKRISNLKSQLQYRKERIEDLEARLAAYENSPK